MRKNRVIKPLTHTLLLTLFYQLIFPAYAYALTSGPMQPEVQSFEPVGTTEMVDLFSGDFNYNIPLMDVDGYPINIFYHSGVGIEQEASWVGLGWNINPGEINRMVRGVPDDFNGEKIEREIHIETEREVRVGIGVDASLELLGDDILEDGVKVDHKTDLSLDVGAQKYVAFNNYRGISVGSSTSLGLSSPFGGAGINIGMGSQTGADIDFSARLSTDKLLANAPIGASFSGGVGMNSRTGVKDLSLGMSVYARQAYTGQSRKDPAMRTHASKMKGVSAQASIPVGMQNYVPVITNKMMQVGGMFQVKVGISNAGTTASALAYGLYTQTSYSSDGSRKAYGYQNMQFAGKDDMLDFSRENDGQYNKTVKNLPLPSLSYDIYTVNGQGTGGMFRAHRNDLGTVYDPYVSPEPVSVNITNQLEVGAPGVDYGELGDDITGVVTVNKSGPWNMLPFARKIDGSIFEPWYFKQAGELSYNQHQEAKELFTAEPFSSDAAFIYFMDKGGQYFAHPSNYYFLGTQVGRPIWNNSVIDRSSRATLISSLTFDEIQKIPEATATKRSFSYSGDFPKPASSSHLQNEIYAGSNLAYRVPGHQIAKLTQTQPDGRRYVYGLPVMTNVTREISFAADEENPSKLDLVNRYVSYNSTEISSNNPNGRDKFYSSTVTPAHVGSYLITEVLSNDYVDIMGDGPSDDDLGSFVKYNYELKSDDYRWKAPYPSNKAHYDPGFEVDTKDGKGNLVIGSRQLWHVKSIESKNFIAEFYTSTRDDARGSTEAVLPNGSSYADVYENSISSPASASSYKLDSIRLFNKHDRYLNNATAVPIKTVIFQYDNSLCKGLPNSSSPAIGKLTLKRIYISYGNSHKNLLSPYEFTYHASNPNYDYTAKDRWGNYKARTSGESNFDFPYCSQRSEERSSQDYESASWNLTDIKLPSGGNIHVDYECDDYSFVQNKRAMNMFKVAGIGSSKAFVPFNQLYQSKDLTNRYIYFQRDIALETPGKSLRQNYFDGEEYMYYSMAIDIGGNGKYDHIKGYSKIKDIGHCPGSSNMGYIEIEEENIRGAKIHPATLQAMNTGRYYLPQYFYDGYNVSMSSPKEVLLFLVGRIPELVNSLVKANPLNTFMKKGKSRGVALSKSYIRLQTPGLTKRGGGIRVKRLTLGDNWEKLAGSGTTATYGKEYQYTIDDPEFGKISSGVASYEPFQGGDENPLRQPIRYSAEQFKGLPSIDFFRDEPYGESLFPTATVGYSRVTVKSIHAAYGRSSQSFDQHEFYTAKDFPIAVSYTNKEAAEEQDIKPGYQSVKATATQGYSVVLNDMHGKPKSIKNFVIHKGPSGTDFSELISGRNFKYNVDENGRLNNKVKALVRKRGTENFYEIKDAYLGQDIDYAIDSRMKFGSTTTEIHKYGLNVLQILGVPAPIPSYFTSADYKSKEFRCMVTSKVIQQYGIVSAVEEIDHGATTVTENLIYDGETGNVLLSRTNNEFEKNKYQTNHPAYLAYEGMRPAYTNDGYEEIADFVVAYDRKGYIYTDNFDRFSPGDELLLTNGTQQFKVWVLGTGVDNSEAPPPNGKVSFALVNQGKFCSFPKEGVSVKITKAGADVAAGFLNSSTSSGTSFCGAPLAFTKQLDDGSYNYTASFKGSSTVRTGSFTISKGTCTEIPIYGECPDIGYLSIELNGNYYIGGLNCPYILYSAATYYSVGRLKTMTMDDIDEANMIANFGGVMWKYKKDLTTETKLPGDVTCDALPTGYYQMNIFLKNYFSIYGAVGLTKAIFEIKKGKTLHLEYRPTTKCSSLVINSYYTEGACEGISGSRPYGGGGSSGGSGGGDMTKLTKTTGSKQCGLVVAPRYLDKFDAAGTNQTDWPVTHTEFLKSRVKVIRSGRRNNLDQSVQQTRFVSGPLDLEAIGLSSLLNRKTDLLDVSGSTFSDEAQMYDGFTNSATIASDYRYEQFNPYVLGTRGTYRPAKAYVPVAERDYLRTYSGTDGLFNLSSLLWTIDNGKVVTSDVCDGPTDILQPLASIDKAWKTVSQVTRYDIYGNAIEERDAIGNYSSAQYGYNKALPISVASNAPYQSCFFDGFEDYDMLLPEKIGAFFLTGDVYSAFRALFGNAKAGSMFSAYDQKFQRRELNPSGSSLILTKEASHTGSYSMKSNAAIGLGISVGSPTPGKVGVFKFLPLKKYLIQLWARSVSGTIDDGTVKVGVGWCSDFDMKRKTGNLDGWYLLEAVVDLSPSCAYGAESVVLKIPAGIYVDDVRALPVSSNMKSFVYDPMSFKLIAQMDENHMATFFEYDQEGLLVRTKKETVRGIMTISENRRANSKN